MVEETFDIQKLVQETGIPRRTIYFYVQQGILPPPGGAGLAAFYTREHLLRLRLIPVLREQGLRLDDIRERLAGMSLEEMERELSRSQAPKPSPRLDPVDENGPGMAFPARPGTPARQGRTLVQYELPGGVMLTAPANLNPDGERRLQMLLEAAAQIYQLPYRMDGSGGKSNPGSMPPKEE